MNNQVTGPEVKPTPHPFYGDSYERGLDPWHENAFPQKFKYAGTKGVQKEGWFLIDGAGNEIGFIPDGTPITQVIHQTEVKVIDPPND